MSAGDRDERRGLEGGGIAAPQRRGPAPGKGPTLIERDLLGTGGASNKIGHTSLIQQQFGTGGEQRSEKNGGTMSAAMGFDRVAKPAEKKNASAPTTGTQRSASTGNATPPGSGGVPLYVQAMAARGHSFADIPIHAPDRGSATGTPGEHAFAKATGSAAAEVPHRAEMEHTFGADFGGVQAHVGQGDALSPVGARAAARGDEVAFASPSPDRSLVAHELTHVVQQRSAGTATLAAKAESSPNDSAEREADAIADQVAGGAQHVTVSAAPAAGIHFDRKDKDKTHAPSSARASGQAGGHVVLGGDVVGASVPAPAPSPKDIEIRQEFHAKEIATAVEVYDVTVDNDHLTIRETYKLEARPAETSEVPDIHIVTEREMRLDTGTGGIVVYRVTGDAIAPGNVTDPVAAVRAPSRGAQHDGQVLVLATGEAISVFGHFGKAHSLAEDGAGNDLLSYDEDPTKRLLALKHFLEERNVPGHEKELADIHHKVIQWQKEVPDVVAELKRYVAARLRYEDGNEGTLDFAKFTLSQIGEAIYQLRQVRNDKNPDIEELERLFKELNDARNEALRAKPPEKGVLDHLGDLAMTPVRMGEGLVKGGVEYVEVLIDTGAEAGAAFGKATGLYHYDWDPISSLGKSIKKDHLTSGQVLDHVVFGIVDEFKVGFEHARNGDYSKLFDATGNAFLMIDGLKATAEVAVTRTEQLVTSFQKLSRDARLLERVANLPRDVRDLATASGDAFDAFLAARADAGAASKVVPDASGAAAMGGSPSPPGAWIGKGLRDARDVYYARKLDLAKGHTVESFKGKLGGAQGGADVDAWAAKVEAAFGDRARAATNYFKAAELRVADPAPYLAQVENLLGNARIAADELPQVLQQSMRAADPTKFLEDVAWLSARQISNEALANLLRKATSKTAPDLDWLRRTALTDRDLEFLAADPHTQWGSFEKVSSEPSPAYPQPVGDRGLGKSAWQDANKKIRGAASELVADETELPGGFKIQARQIARDGKRPDFQLVDATGNEAELEVKGWTAETWTSELDLGIAKSNLLSHMKEQLHAGLTTGKPVYLAVSDVVAGKLQRRLTAFLGDQGLGDVRLVYLQESEIQAVSARLRDAMKISPSSSKATP